MNIIIVCRELPYPPDSGTKIRMYNLLKRLSRNNCIALLCYDFGVGAEKKIPGIQDYCVTIKLVRPRISSKIRQVPDLLMNFMRGEPLCAKYEKSKSMKDAIQELIKTTAPDLIHFDDPYLATNSDFENKDNIIRTITYIDVDSQKYLRMYKIEKNIRKKAMLLLDLLLLKRWEEASVKKADLNIAMSPVDAKNLKPRTGEANITVIPNGVDTGVFKFDRSGTKIDTISFIGDLGYLPNQDAVLFFYQEILPIIRRKIQGVKFMIVGRNPGPEVQDLKNDPHVIVTGEVANVIPYYYKSAVVAVPLRSGGGTRIKILEAMSLGRPVVTTAIGCEGLDVKDGEHLLIANEPEQFAEKIALLLKDRQMYDHISTQGRQLVEIEYDWGKIAGRLIDAYTELIAQRGPLKPIVQG